MMDRSDFKKLVVDVGANDGILSSNSFNFIELGWNATLIEPIASQLNLAKVNHETIIDPYNDGEQKIQYVLAALTEEKNGNMKMAFARDKAKMESFEINSGKRLLGDENIINVEGLSVEKFVKIYHLPKNFGLLSIDTEGSSDKLLLKFLELGYRPFFIICELLHTKTPGKDLVNILETKYKYKLLNQMGWNLIFEKNYL